MCQADRVVLCEGFPVRLGFLLDDTCRLSNQAGQQIPQMARIGTMSEYAVVPEQSLIKINPDYPLEKAALVGCGVTTGVGAVINTAQVQPGEWVAVIGAGGVGLNAVQGAKLAGAERIFTIDLVERKLKFAAAFGATDLINASQVDPVEVIQDLTDGKGVDYAFEVIGKPETIRLAYQIIRRAGMAVVIGIASPSAQIEIPAQDLVRTEKRLVGSFYGSAVPRVDMPRLLNWYNQGQIKLDELITQTYTLDQINQAFDDLNAGRNARGMIRYS
jgi:S-(hydroxymethyl)glutathione dehydrogenase/alcohol dehydrogenase